MEKKQKEKKIVFSEEIDSLINGLALGLTFVATGVVLVLIPDYFGNKIVGNAIRWLFIVVGALGLFVELGKLKPISGIKGFDDFWVGALCLAVWAVFYFLAHHVLANIIGFFFLVIGGYGGVSGVFKIAYSIHLARKNNKIKKGNVASDVLVLLTKVASIILVVIQIVQALQ